MIQMSQIILLISRLHDWNSILSIYGGVAKV